MRRSVQLTVSYTFAVTLLGIATWTSARVLVPVKSCRQYLLKQEIGVLMNDLDCPGSAYGVFLDGASFRMNGHSIQGASSGNILCKGSCKVTGPGEITQSNVGIAMFADQARRGRILVAGVDLHDNADGIHVSEPVPSDRLRITLENVTSNHNINDGISCAAAHLKGQNVTTSDNGDVGLRAGASVILNHFTSSGNSLGYDNLGDAPTLLRASTIIGSTSGVDLATKIRPILIDTTCEHSLGPNLQPWGVCSGD